MQVRRGGLCKPTSTGINRSTEVTCRWTSVVGEVHWIGDWSLGYLFEATVIGWLAGGGSSLNTGTDFGVKSGRNAAFAFFGGCFPSWFLPSYGMSLCFLFKKGIKIVQFGIAGIFCPEFLEDY